MAALRQRVGFAHQYNEATAFARPEALGALVVDTHLVRRQRTGPGKADQLEGIETQIHAAGEHHVEIARSQRIARIRDGQECQSKFLDCV